MENEEVPIDECNTQPESDLRKDIEKLIDVMFPPESRQHMLRAATEVMLAIDAAVPKGMVPQEVRDQCNIVKKEVVSLAKTMAHSVKYPEESEKKEEDKETGLQKIEFT